MIKISFIKYSAVIGFALLSCNAVGQAINRKVLTERNNPHITQFDSLASLSVGNGNFAYTVDATGLQTFPELYAKGVPLGTQSQWGWHSFPNTEHCKHEEALKNYNFRGKEEPYSVQFKEPGRQQDAANYLRANAHRLHLGYVGLELTKKDGSKVNPQDIKDINQTLNLWDGLISSNYIIEGNPVAVQTAVHPDKDQIAVALSSALIKTGQLKINFRFPYPTGNHTDDATNWSKPGKHKTEVVRQDGHSFVLKRTLDDTVYYVTVQYTGKAKLSQKEPHYFILSPQSADFSFTCTFTEKTVKDKEDAQSTLKASATYWNSFWKNGAAIDFSKCTNPRAKELERRVVLSQYLMAIQSAGKYPPQETGLTYNSWFGKFHLEMHWWHAVHFALWNRTDLLERSMDWYSQAYPVAKEIAQRQGFKGIRWMKMTDPSAQEAPSGVGSFLIWQQPHFIYMSELIYRNNPDKKVLEKYNSLVQETAAFMASFADYDKAKDRYILQGIIAAQETLRASETVNPPFELSYWHYALTTAQKWRERMGQTRKPEWDVIIAKLSQLTAKDGLYLASEDAVTNYTDVRFTSDHPAVLGAVGILPQTRLLQPEIMKNTLNWIWDNWNWDETWGWDYPMVAMNAARLGEPEKAVGALLMDKRTNTYLVNGHNYQDERLRVYLPGNGGLLTAVAMMCAGWDGSTGTNPGFPQDGTWNVVWEGLKPMP
ncbi:hypothetical protein AM493_06040 [Flavobacterium akiainvivens]|uniref:Glycosyl hydrolase family 95 N-terminal domain-containing protein n=1 Tax=Flavobacterium akiainvivens TaxID=1202724 RepID=A0A0M9VHK0_9FLAO|nr:hypothetical protein [Flavobacterium akiainvivens]KOS05642.1 hypothetical protein AM493_06040 [Flavobacterium akiainvivens]SFQ35902.1 hypothetical protein SAMN05444144_103244 [Flavobacterium akiainvivens]